MGNTWVIIDLVVSTVIDFKINIFANVQIVRADKGSQ